MSSVPGSRLCSQGCRQERRSGRCVMSRGGSVLNLSGHLFCTKPMHADASLKVTLSTPQCGL